MSASIRRLTQVDDDIAETALYYFKQNADVADRFIDAVQTTLKELAQMPGMGSRKAFQDPRLSGIRSWLVRGFRNHVIFYRPIDEGIMVFAILHGARDIEAILSGRV